MTTIPTSVAALLADLAAHGIAVERHGDAIRYRPRLSMTPPLMERLQAHKAELLRFLDTEAMIAELRQLVNRLGQNPAWRSAWEQRFRAAQYADFASLQRVLESVIEQAAEHHRRRDWSAFASTYRYLHRLALGELWDEAARKSLEFSSDLTTSLI